MSSWQTIYKSPLQHQAAIVKDVLEGENIHVVVLDKKDQSYNLGVFEVMVNEDDVMKAIKLIQDETDFS